jgi:hypothetical protein
MEKKLFHYLMKMIFSSLHLTKMLIFNMLCTFGGILLGVRTDSMEVLAHSVGEYHIKFHIRNRADNFIWSLVAVYGAAQEAHKAAFLRELVNLAKENPHPILIGGILIC